MPPSNRKTALFIQAEKLRMARRYGEAIPIYESVLVEDPDDLDVRRTLSGLYLMQGEPRKIVVGYLLLAGCLIADTKLAQAEALLGRVRSLDADGTFADKIASLAAQIETAQARAHETVEPSAEIVEERIVIEEIVEEVGPDAVAEPAPEPEVEVAAEPPILALDETTETPEIILDESGPIEVPDTSVELEAADLSDADIEEIRLEAERDATDPTRSAARLSTILFSHVPPDTLSDIIQTCQTVPFPKGTSIFLEGSESDSVMVLGDGIAEGRARRSEDGTMVPIALFEPGEILGLMAFLTEDVHDLAVVAESDCVCYRLSYDEMERLMAEHTDFGMAVLGAYKDHVISLFMRTSRVLSELPEGAQHALVRAFELTNANTDEVIIAEGTPGDDLYFIKKGAVKVVTDRGGSTIELARMGKHEFFGEISFLTGTVRTASVLALGPTELLRVTGDKMWSIADEHPTVKDVLKDVHDRHAEEQARKLREEK